MLDSRLSFPLHALLFNFVFWFVLKSRLGYACKTCLWYNQSSLVLMKNLLSIVSSNWLYYSSNSYVATQKSQSNASYYYPTTGQTKTMMILLSSVDFYWNNLDHSTFETKWLQTAKAQHTICLYFQKQLFHNFSFSSCSFRNTTFATMQLEFPDVHNFNSYIFWYFTVSECAFPYRWLACF